MSEFKFSCPNCQQNIAATSEYSGVQINCPNCQSPIVVPAAPMQAQARAVSDNPLVPAPPAHTKLSMAASTAAHAATATAHPIQGKPVRKKKDRTRLYVGLAASACGIAGLIFFWQQISNLGRSAYAKVHKEEAPVVQAPTNEPPPPPELSTEEILQNVGDKYKSLTNFAVRGLSISVVDVSAVMPGTPKQNSTEAVSLELGRSNLYRFQWEIKATGTPYQGAAWSAGKGDYIGYGPNPAVKTKNRQTALAMASTRSQAQCISLAQLFFDDTNSVARMAAAFAKTNGPGLVTRINGHNCYVLDGQFEAHDLVLWIDKESFLIPQIQFAFGGNLDETTLKGRPAAEKLQLTTWAKLKGTITETYDTPDLDKGLTAAAFEADFAPTFNIQMQQGQAPGAGRQRQRGANAGSPTQLTRRVRDATQNQQQQ
jgi:hypothetical protein